MVWDPKRSDLRPDAFDVLEHDAPVVPAEVALAVLRPFFEHDDVDLAFDDDRVSLEDIEIGISESSTFLAVDWRAVLVEELSTIEAQLAALGVECRVTPGDRGDDCGATVEIRGKSADVRYRPADEGADFDEVIAGLNRLVTGTAQYRRVRRSRGSDTYEYAVLPTPTWAGLDARHPVLLGALFEPIDTRPPQ